MSGVYEGPVRCGAWIRWWDRRNPNQSQKQVLALSGRCGSSTCPPLLEVYSFDSKSASLSSSPVAKCELDGDPLGFAVLHTGDEFICATSKGCRLFELQSYGSELKVVEKDLPALQSVGPQKCLAFSTDGSRFATGGEDGHLRIFEWPSQNLLLDERKAHKSFLDMDISLDSEFLATTSTDGAARIWKINEGVPLTSLSRKPDEKIERCRFSRDGAKPFLFCIVKKGAEVVTAVWEMSEWKRIGHRRLLQKPISVLSVSLDGKYLAMGSYDGDMCIVDVKSMEVRHWSKKLHLGTAITSLEFCPTERVVLSTSNQWGAIATRLSVPADWKEWQIYLLLLGLFLASLALFYVLYEKSDSFWNFPLGREQPGRPLFRKRPVIEESRIASDDQSSPW